MPKKGAASPYKSYSGVDDYAAPWSGRLAPVSKPVYTAGETKRAGAYGDVKKAGKQNRKGY